MALALEFDLDKITTPEISHFTVRIGAHTDGSMSKFGEEFEKNWPEDLPPITKFGRQLLEQCESIQKPTPISVNEIIDISNKFPAKFPIDRCRIKSRPPDEYEEIQAQVASAYPVIHERALWLCLRFLEHKCEYGNRKEKRIYQNMSLAGLIQRLLAKRCVMFYNSCDMFLLISGEKGREGFEEIGTENEEEPLVLENCLSYDEMKLSALLSVSSYTQFLNDGNRFNCGKIERESIVPSGVIIGLIGARFEREQVMEYQDIVISDEQNTTENGYGAGNLTEIQKRRAMRRVWDEFYGENSKLFTDVQKDGKRFGNTYSRHEIFDNVVMKKRYTISFDTLLLESKERAAKAGKGAYIHVVGIGLGVWNAALQQEEVFLETFAQRLRYLMPKLKHISHVHFSWFNTDNCGGVKHGESFVSSDHPKGGIKIFISLRNPAAKLEIEDAENVLLVVSYAWDGNALPGNEFWGGLLSASGDPAAACSTLITELHNSHINKTMISGDNLHIASPKFGVMHIADYVRKLKA